MRFSFGFRFRVMKIDLDFLTKNDGGFLIYILNYKADLVTGKSKTKMKIVKKQTSFNSSKSSFRIWTVLIRFASGVIRVLASGEEVRFLPSSPSPTVDRRLRTAIKPNFFSGDRANTGELKESPENTRINIKFGTMCHIACGSKF